MADEELNLDSPIPMSPPNGQVGGEELNKMEMLIPNITGSIGPGATPAEVLDQVLRTPELIPWETCTLPSNGLYYKWSNGTIEVRGMGQMAEAMLANQRLGQSGQAIAKMFKQCCKFPNSFNPNDLLVGDHTFLLYYLRGITHGRMYEFGITCPNCGNTATYAYDLTDLAKTIKWADARLGQEPFKVILPYLSEMCGREFWVGLRFLRASDVTAMTKRAQAQKTAVAKPGSWRQQEDDNDADLTLNDNLSRIIVSAMGESDPFKVRELIPKLHATDTSAIREWLKDNTPGIDTTISVTCSGQCATRFTVELPLTESFFRSTKRPRVRT